MRKAWLPTAALIATLPTLPSLIGVGGDAIAGTPTGTCTNSYSPYTYGQLGFDPDAQAIFSVIDTNGDGVICFKPYPNGLHNGHAGNLVDDKAAPHS